MLTVYLTNSFKKISVTPYSNRESRSSCVVMGRSVFLISGSFVVGDVNQKISGLHSISATDFVHHRARGNLPRVVIKSIRSVLRNTDVLPKAVTRLPHSIDQILDLVPNSHRPIHASSPPWTMAVAMSSHYIFNQLLYLLIEYRIKKGLMKIKPTAKASAAKGSNLPSTGYPHLLCNKRDKDTQDYDIYKLVRDINRLPRPKFRSQRAFSRPPPAPKNTPEVAPVVIRHTVSQNREPQVVYLTALSPVERCLCVNRIFGAEGRCAALGLGEPLKVKEQSSQSSQGQEPCLLANEVWKQPES